MTRPQPQYRFRRKPRDDAPGSPVNGRSVAANHADGIQKSRVTAVENLVCAALAIGILVSSFTVEAFGGSALYRNLGIAIAGALVGAATVMGLASRPRDRSPKTVRSRDALFLSAMAYFLWVGTQRLVVYSRPEALSALESFIALLALAAVVATDRQRLMEGLRRWLLVVVIATLVPALMGQGFEPGRVWVQFLPGRYFGFSNPNGLAFVAGMVVLLAVPVLRERRSRLLVFLGTVLVVLTAGITTAIGLGLGLVAYFALGRVRNTGFLRILVRGLALATPVVLLWLPTDNAIRFFSALQTMFELSGRSLLWVELLRETRDSHDLWTGFGDRAVAQYTASILDVATAHSTIIQMYLSAGILTTTLFVLVAALATNRILVGSGDSRLTSGHPLLTKEDRAAFAVVVYWFVVSLTSTQPSTAFVFCIVVAMAVAGPNVGAETPPRPEGKATPSHSLT